MSAIAGLGKLAMHYDVLQGIAGKKEGGGGVQGGAAAVPPVMMAVTDRLHVSGGYASSSGAGACQNTMSSRNPSCHTHNMT